jgi:hypothetical protein
LTLEDIDHVLGSHGGLAHDIFVGSRPDVGSDEGAGRRKQRVIWWGRLFIHDIRGVTTKSARAQRFYQGPCFDKFPSRAIDEEQPGPGHRKTRSIDHVAGAIGQHGVEGDHIAALKQFVRVRDALDTVFRSKRFVPMVAKA